MFTLGAWQRFFLYGGAVDMRKGFDGLSGLVRNSLDRDPLSGEVYIFLNRSRTLIKLLHWEAGGLVIHSPSWVTFWHIKTHKLENSR